MSKKYQSVPTGKARLILMCAAMLGGPYKEYEQLK
jgi:hypothetical protein